MKTDESLEVGYVQRVVCALPSTNYSSTYGFSIHSVPRAGRRFTAAAADFLNQSEIIVRRCSPRDAVSILGDH